MDGTTSCNTAIPMMTPDDSIAIAECLRDLNQPLGCGVQSYSYGVVVALSADLVIRDTGRIGKD
jgi:predicted metalloprotease with PDZ domain